MILKFKGGISGKGATFEPGDLVEWKDEADCVRLIDRGVAVKASPDEIKAAAGKIMTYQPPKARPEEKWPPAPLRKLPKEDAA